eukprot:TRINITY_DN2226_c0_g3_i1.p1 TRINITY_DN2226_c0_g3~~TRINITY_DN2226_c0_g3_i1.p1  ORF type:complete len:184 (-),score=56.02 TRINITY_DN2226_c0_g3_i1:428-979(-)
MSVKSKKQEMDKLSNDFDNFNRRFLTLCATAKEKMEDTPLELKIDLDSSHYSNSQQQQIQSQQQQQQLLHDYQRVEHERQFQEDIIEERDKEIMGIQHEMADVNALYLDIATLVDAQREFVDDIETNIITSRTNVVKANADLQKAEQLQKESRRRLCYIAIGIAVLVVVVVLIVVLTVKRKAN